MATYTIASGDTLGGIAAKNKTTVANLMTLNPTIKDPNKIYAGASLNLGNPTPLSPTPSLATPPKAPSTTMVASDIQSNATTPAPTLPPPPAPLPDYSGTLKSIPTIESIVAPAKPSAAEVEQTGLMASLKGLYEKMLGKSSAQAKAEEAAGLPGFNTQLNDINAQIKQLQAESSSATIRADDRLAPTFAIQGEQTRIEHERTIKALGLSSISAALQGNIALAQQQADSAVEKEFGPIQEQIDYQQKLLDLNKETLSREDKKALVLQQAQLDERQRLLDNAKEDKGIIIGWAAEASKNGASSYVVNQALAESDPSKVLGILSGFLTDPMAKEKALAELDQTRAQTNLINANISKTNKEASAIGAKSDSTVVAGNLAAYGADYASTGKLPSPAELKQSGLNVSDVTAYAKTMPKPIGALIDNNTGVKPSTLSPEQEKGITAMSEIIRDTLPSLKEQFPKLYTGLLGGVGGQIYTSQDRQDYLTYRQEFLNKLLVARSGATVTPQEYERYSKMLPGEFNQLFFMGSDGLKKITAMQKAMTTNFDSLLDTQQVSIVGYSDVRDQIKQLSPEQKAELQEKGLLPKWAL